MNPLNYASLEASKRLVDNGIILETDVVWSQMAPDKDYSLVPRYNARLYSIPAPSMAEVWRDLPLTVEVRKAGYKTCAFEGTEMSINTNPTDALIDLLIFTRGKNDIL